MRFALTTLVCLLTATGVPSLESSTDDDQHLPSDPLESGLSAASDDDSPAGLNLPVDSESSAADDDNPAGASKCKDGTKNRFETDTDCGGFECDKCDAGHTCRDGATDCASGVCEDRKCKAATPDGSTPFDKDIEAVVGCPSGSYFWGSHNGKNFCVKCPSGFTSRGCSDCKPDPERDACFLAMRCPAGKFPDSGICSACAAGKIRRMSSQQIKCSSCAKGKYQPRASQVACEACDRGKYTPTEGSVSCRECANSHSCPVGRYPKATGSLLIFTEKQLAHIRLACLVKQTAICAHALDVSSSTVLRMQHYGTQLLFFAGPRGKFGPHSNSTSCTSCASGLFQSAAGAKSCLTCPSGKYNCRASDRGKHCGMEGIVTSRCVECKSGRFAIKPHGASWYVAAYCEFFTCEAIMYHGAQVQGREHKIRPRLRDF
jgi:hypothetical protein